MQWYQDAPTGDSMAWIADPGVVSERRPLKLGVDRGIHPPEPGPLVATMAVDDHRRSGRN